VTLFALYRAGSYDPVKGIWYDLSAKETPMSIIYPDGRKFSIHYDYIDIPAEFEKQTEQVSPIWWCW